MVSEPDWDGLSKTLAADALTRKRQERESLGIAVPEGFYYAMVDVDIIRDESISVPARFLYTLLRTYVNVTKPDERPNSDDDNPAGTTFVGKDTLSVRMGTPDKPATERAVRKWLAELADAGVIEVERRYWPGGKQRRSRYWMRDSLLGVTKAGRQQIVAARNRAKG